MCAAPPPGRDGRRRIALAGDSGRSQGCTFAPTRRSDNSEPALSLCIRCGCQYSPQRQEMQAVSRPRRRAGRRAELSMLNTSDARSTKMRLEEGDRDTHEGQYRGPVGNESTSRSPVSCGTHIARHVFAPIGRPRSGSERASPSQRCDLGQGGVAIVSEHHARVTQLGGPTLKDRPRRRRGRRRPARRAVLLPDASSRSRPVTEEPRRGPYATVCSSSHLRAAERSERLGEAGSAVEQV